ncbi:unnamed protein product [Bursaphelenchus okinawaensis]|uniref:Sas10 C-terminal domain-containing protein n=1 Tax=Bursaphelenchus okinawaensis TaxID=465554 RepID=A0A811K783_9BILA|nr:unnamed protein product [Bursaphelenchus okinawaensis]CAG9094719.1 unnamed protein product [Bursaphelenchus okinawaensis]
MAKRKGGKRRQITSATEPERDTDDVYDEVDAFHNERNKDINVTKKARKGKEIEVLNVQADGLDDLYEEDDLDKPDEEPLMKIVSANQWGKSRRDFYVNNKTRTKEDGYLNDEEQELLDLEEEDATERQKRLDKKNSVLNFDQFFEDDDDQVQEDKPVQKMTLRERMALAAAERRKQEEAAAKQKGKDKEVEERKLFQKKHEQDDDSEVEETFVEGWDDYDKEDDDVEKRGINYQIEKNKGLVQKRKKGTEHSRIKRRLQYKKALVRRRSQIPDVKREMQKYTGEVRGIRASTVKSIKIKA